MKYLLEAKVFHCLADLSLCLLSFPYYKGNVGGIGILNNLLLVTVLLKSYESFRFVFLPA